MGRITIGAISSQTTLGVPTQYTQFTKVFSEEESHNFPPVRIWDHAIELKPGAPATIPGKIYSLSQTEQEETHEFIKGHLKRGTIRPSKGPYAAPFFYIKKKDGKLRPVQDYRRLNEWTIHNRSPLPLIPQLVDRLRGCTLYTKFDIRWGYNNIRIKDGDQWKAAFITNEGLFEPTVMFFGLTNSLATFQTMMNTLFSEEIALKWLTIYMDDMAIHTGRKPEETDEQHLLRHRAYIKIVLERLEKHDLYLKPEKCTFEQNSIEFLGVKVENRTVQMDDEKVHKVQQWLIPTNVTEIRKFLGFTGYYRYFIQNYSAIARPLLELTHKATPWHWTDRQQEAFETLRNKMCTKPILQQPDFSKKFYIQTDASAYGVGAILSQEGGSEKTRKKTPTRNPNYTHLRTIQPPSPPQKGTMTSTKENYWQ
jgi:Reverse transcriptase (RNA-dependent DNA polymerase)/RNase H-like domain found in reverse transcriptase